MGFDIECIVDIHTYPGEYFCPVCRTLVYPNEAFQAQCTHLYCKSCLGHIANGTRACPYDGYLVTESDSKPLIESDKTLAENIGKVKVHCLYFRSGCTWEGSLSDCTSHCSECSFGNSPVICNRCGTQIVHRQVHDHALSCPGVYEGQQAVTKSGTTSSTTTADGNQIVAQAGAALPQAHNPQNVSATPLPGQNPTMQSNVISQAPAAAPLVPTPTPEQQYYQQYQQYYQQYQQYPGYDPYQQHSQQYYPPQQPFQQYQQQPLPVQGHNQSHVPPQPQLNPISQAPQMHSVQLQGQSQPQLQPQIQSLPQSQSQLQAQGQAPVYAPIQATAPSYQVNPQQQHQPPIRPPQTLPPPPPHSQPMQPPPVAQATGMRPPPLHPQAPQYQQPHVQMQHPQASQAHVQTQMHIQPQSHSQPSNQSHMQIQPLAQPYHTQSQPQPPVFPPQINQSTAPTSMPQAMHLQVPPVSGHHSYQQPQPAQNIQSGASQQHSMHPVYGQGPQQPTVMRPPHSHGSLPQQQSPALLPPLTQVPGMYPAQHQQFPPQPAHSIQHRPVMQPVQQAVPQQYAQQPPPNHLHQQSHFMHQQPTQPQLRAPYPPQAQHSQNYVGMPMMPNQGIHLQSHPLPSGGFGPVAHSGPAINQNYANSNVLEHNETAQKTFSPKGLIDKDSEGKSIREEVVTEKNGTVVKDTSTTAEDGLTKSVSKQEQADVQGSLEQASGGKSYKSGPPGHELLKEEGRLKADSDSLRQVELDNKTAKSSQSVVMGPSSANFYNQSQAVVSASSQEGVQRPQAQVQGQPQSIPAPQGQGIFPHAGQSTNPTEGMTPGYFGSQPKSFESQSAPQGPPLASLSDPHGVMVRAPPLRREGEFGSQLVRPNEDAMLKDQMSGSHEGGPSFMKTYGNDQSLLQMNGATAPDSSMRPLDQASRSYEKAPQWPTFDAGSKFDSGAFGPKSRLLPAHHPSGGHGHADTVGPGPEFDRQQTKHFTSRSPDRQYLGSSPRGFDGPSSFPRGISGFNDINASAAQRFGEGSRSFNDPVGNPFRDGRFPPLPGHPRRGEFDGPANPRFGDHMAPGVLHNHRGREDVFGREEPGHVMRGKFPGPGNMPNHFNVGENAGPGGFHGRAQELGGPGNFPRPPFSEPAGGDRSSFQHFGGPPMRDSYPPPFAGGMDSLDWTRKRNPVSMGWCRICKVDCETVEGLDLHSQTREHQDMAVDMVKAIKMKNKKKQKTSAGHMVHEGGSRGRKAGFVGRGS